MRPRFLISLLALAAVVLTVAFWLRPVQRTAMTKPSQESVQQTNNVSSAAVSNNGQNVSSNSQSKASPPADSRPITTSFQERQLEAIQQANEKNSQPIKFYGKIIDQDGNPLSGAKINVSIQQTLASAPTASGDIPLHVNIQRFEKESGDDGRFEINNEKGEGVDIESVQKDGYEVEPDNCPHVFGPSIGAYESPAVFKMWSKNIHEQLITGEKDFEVLPDGRSHMIDLTKGTIDESGSGDLKVWIQYTNQVVRGQLYDWSAGIEAINGGLLEEPRGTVMYSAPTDGYTPSFSLQQQIKGGQSGEIGDRSFYLELKNGQEYGKMDINLFAPYGYLHPGLIRLSYAINPSGSRILR